MTEERIKRKRVLLVEDSQHFAGTFRRRFKSLFPEVDIDVALDFNDAIDEIQRKDSRDEPYDAILLDSSLYTPGNAKTSRRAEDVVYSIMQNRGQIYHYRTNSFSDDPNLGDLGLKHPNHPKIIYLRPMDSLRVGNPILHRIDTNAFIDKDDLLKSDNIDATKAWLSLAGVIEEPLTETLIRQRRGGFNR